MSDENQEPESSTETQKETEENRVPQSRVDEITARYKDQLREKEEELERMKAEKPADRTESYTRAQLLNMVEEGQITQVQADEYWEQQLEQKFSQQAQEQAQQQALVQQIQTQINEYKSLVPGLDEPGHENRSELQRKYNELVSMGHPNDVRSEVTALETVFGSLSKLKQKKTSDKLTREGRDTHQETGESGGHEEGKDVTKDLDKRHKDHYQKMIDQGLYKDWGEVRKELEQYGKSHTR